MSYLGSGPTRFNTADDLTVTDDAEIKGDLVVQGTADINGGTIDGVTIGGASAGAGTFTTLTATGNVDIDGGTIKLDGNSPNATRNVFIGDGAGGAITTGIANVAVGNNALPATTTSNSNIAVGDGTLASNITGADNIAIGQAALGANTASSNTAVGYGALLDNTTGSNNVALGKEALESNTTASNNTAVGHVALTANTTGSNNTAVGLNAGATITTGSDNTFIGSYAGQGAPSSASNRIALGYNVAPVGDGYFTFGEGSGSNRVFNQFTANASWTHTSDERLKKEIQTNTDCGLDFINDLRTVTYKFKAPSELDPTLSEYDPNKTTPSYDKKMYGFIAQEVKSAMDAHNITDFAGWNQIDDGGQDNMQGISYEMFVMPLVKAVQELKAELDAAKARIEALENQ